VNSRYFKSTGTDSSSTAAEESEGDGKVRNRTEYGKTTKEQKEGIRINRIKTTLRRVESMDP
jgi:hypothetical protein